LPPNSVIPRESGIGGSGMNTGMGYFHGQPAGNQASPPHVGGGIAGGNSGTMMAMQQA